MLGFERPLAPPRWLLPLQLAVGAAAAVGAAMAVASVHARLGLAAAAATAAACVVVLLAGAARARAAHRSCTLHVDDAGRARLRIAGRDHDCVPRRWLLADGWVALTLRLSGPGAAAGRTIDLVSGARLSGARAPDDSWRRLRVWLLWLRRGGVPEGDFDADSRASR